MRPFFIVFVIVVFLPALAPAQPRSVFPYEAVIETDGVPIHSGPGGKFYETARLKCGSRVTVHRHDPGGWYMIAPPEGEFGLIAAQSVRPVVPGTGEIVAEEVDVHIGSRTSSRYDAIQIPLSHGDRVQLLDGIAAPQGWVAIRPVRGEYRWIPGRFAVPVPEEVRTELDADPFAVPSIAKRPESFDEVAAAEPAPLASPTGPGPRLALGTPQPETVGTKPADAMRQLDRELEALTLAEPTDWPIDELAAEYRRLRQADPASGRQIDVRLAQLERMRVVKEQYGDYVRLTSATDQRDAELLAKQSVPTAVSDAQLAATPSPSTTGPTLAPPMLLAADPHADAAPLPPSTPTAETGPQIQGGPPFATTGVTNAARPRPMIAAAPAGNPGAAGPLLLAPEAESPVQAAAPAPAAMRPPVPGQPAPPGGPRRFDAVGIVQKAVDPHPEAPQFVLVAPNGRILVYLREQPGIPLEKFVGQPMGVDGARHKHPEMTTPMIVVDRLTPVRF